MKMQVSRRTGDVRQKLIIGMALTVIVGLGLCCWELVQHETKRDFTSIDQYPVAFDSGRDGSLRTYCLMGPASDVAAALRHELSPKGFVEVPSSKPWVKFTKGATTVLVADGSPMSVHDDNTRAGMVMKPALSPFKIGHVASVFVQDRRPDPAGANSYKVWKMIHGW